MSSADILRSSVYVQQGAAHNVIKAAYSGPNVHFVLNTSDTAQ